MKRGILILLMTMFALSTMSGSSSIGQSPSRSATQEPVARPATSITGRVVNENGQPVQNARVIITGYGRQPLRQTVTTDETGAFVFEGLRRGAYFVTAQFPAYVVSRSPGEPLQNRPGDSVNLVLRRGGVITGKVTNSDGEPVVGVPIGATLLRDERGRRSGTTYGNSRYTDDRGVYRLFGLPAGTYIVAAGSKTIGSSMLSAFSDDTPTYYPSSTRDTAAEISLQYGGEATGIDIRYRGQQGHAISGVISETSLPNSATASANVTLMRVANDTLEAQTVVQSRAGERAFGFYGVPDGDYYLTARRVSYLGDDGAASKRVPVKVRGHDVTRIGIDLLPLGSISGRITVDVGNRTAKCETRQPPAIEESLITIITEDEPGADPSSRFASTLNAPDNNGDFVFQWLPGGRYRLDSRRVLDEAWYIRAFTAPSPSNTPVDASRNGLALRAGQRITGVRIVLGEGAASIRGRVVPEREGAPLPDRVRVHLVPAEPDATNDLLRYVEVDVQADGTFRITNLAPGRYWMIAKPLSEERASDRIPRPLAWNATTRGGLRREAETSNAVIDLKPCQRVAEHILKFSERGQPPGTKQ